MGSWKYGMGRHQIIGNEFCPIPTCPSLCLGRFYTKKVRNRSTSQYVERFYYQHNNKKIKEHYVDQYVRKIQTDLLQAHPLGEIIRSINLLADYVDKSTFLKQKVTKQVKTFPLTDNEASELSNYDKQKTEVIAAMSKMVKLLRLGIVLRIEGKEIPKWLEVEEQKLIELFNKMDEQLTTVDKLLIENPSKAIRKAANIVKSDPLYSVYEKYEFPKRLARYKKAGKDNNPRWN